MSSDFNFTVTTWFLGNVGVKPYFNTQCPPTLILGSSEWRVQKHSCSSSCAPLHRCDLKLKIIKNRLPVVQIRHFTSLDLSVLDFKIFRWAWKLGAGHGLYIRKSPRPRALVLVSWPEMSCTYFSGWLLILLIGSSNEFWKFEIFTKFSTNQSVLTKNKIKKMSKILLQNSKISCKDNGQFFHH